jgi:hypothetical protein
MRKKPDLLLVVHPGTGTFFPVSECVVFDWDDLTEEQKDEVNACGEIDSDVLDTLELKTISVK